VRLRFPLLAFLLFALPGIFQAACGGGSPGGPSDGGPTHSVTAVVYYDEDGSGAPDAGEAGRLGGVTVSVGGRTAQSETPSGRAVVSGVPGGTQTAELRALLPFFRPGSPVSVSVPAAGDVMLAATLPIGDNRPNTYMAFGDSITVGEGSRNSQGYVVPLERSLRAFFGQATIANEGQSGTRSLAGASRIGGTLRRNQPAYTLILYGTNDWNECGPSVPCFTIDSLRRICEKTRQQQSLPVLATLPPVNPDAFGADARNNWVTRMNVLIRDLAVEQSALLVDLEPAFKAEPRLQDLFSDHVHPNDRGYDIIADTFFAAITRPGAGGAGFEPFALPDPAGGDAFPTDLEPLPLAPQEPAAQERAPSPRQPVSR
jgi:lysophospholipase L1-like esterase